MIIVGITGFLLGLGLGLAFHRIRTREMRKGGGACFKRNESLGKTNETLSRDNESLKKSNALLRWQNDAGNKTNAELRAEKKRLERQLTTSLNTISELKGRLLVLANLARRVEKPVELPSSVGKPTARLPQIVTSRATRVFTEPLTEALAETRMFAAA